MRTNFMTGEEVVREMRSGSTLARAGGVLRTAVASIDAGLMQRVPLTTIEVRNIEFAAVIEIAAMLGVTLEPGQLTGDTPPPLKT
jgi:hypothetical protein